MNLKTLQATVCLLCCSIVLTAQNEDKLIGAFNGQKSIADSLFFANMMESNLPLRSVVEGDDMSEGYNNGSITTNITGVATHGFGYPVSPTISNSEPGTSVGGMGASFGVSPMGGATCSIPIEVPVGVGGLQPQLAIVYNSQSGNGILNLYVVGDTYDSNGFSFLLQQEQEPLCTTGDLTNNGRSEIVLLEMKNLNGLYRLNIFGYNDRYSPGVNDSLLIKLITPHYDLSLPSDPKQIYISDMNGDGMNDLFIICKEDYKIFWNKGSFQFTATEDNDHEYNWMTTVGDFNGDGLLDVLTNDGSNNCYFYLNNGNGHFTETSACSINSSFIRD